MMRAAAVAALLVVASLAPSAARSGAAHAGMGGVGIGIPNRSGDLSDNPAAAAAGGVDRAEGLVFAGAGLTRLTFAGRAYHPLLTTEDSFWTAFGHGFSVVTPVIGGGRAGLGIWQVDRHALALDEPLDTGLSGGTGDPPLSGAFTSGRVELRQDEGLYVAGLTWLQAMGDGDQHVSLGAGWAHLTARGTLDVTALRTQDELDVGLRRIARRMNLQGAAIQLGWFYRPVADGSLGASILYLTPLSGYVWEQWDGLPVWRDGWKRPAQMRLGLGGAFDVHSTLTVAVDLKYSAETDQTATVFRGTAGQRALREKSDPAFAIHAGLEWRAPLARSELPLRLGFFTRPDPLPASPAAAGGSAVSEFTFAPVRQDVTGFSIGTGRSRAGYSIDGALLWLLVNTHTRLRSATGGPDVDSGDVRSTFGAVLSLTLRYGAKTGD